MVGLGLRKEWLYNRKLSIICDLDIWMFEGILSKAV